jgi:hypothetical protein
MKKALTCVLAVLWAASGSLAFAQASPFATPSPTTSPYAQTSPYAPTSPYAQTKPSPQPNPQVASCDPSGCWGTDGTRYSRGAGNLMFGSNGKTCQIIAPGVPLTCH